MVDCGFVFGYDEQFFQLILLITPIDTCQAFCCETLLVYGFPEYLALWERRRSRSAGVRVIGSGLPQKAGILESLKEIAVTKS